MPGTGAGAILSREQAHSTTIDGSVRVVTTTHLVTLIFGHQGSFLSAGEHTQIQVPCPDRATAEALCVEASTRGHFDRQSYGETTVYYPASRFLGAEIREITGTP
jgi:hypothetical protein